MTSNNYFFKCNNIKISIFNAENEEMAWNRLRETLSKDEDSYDRDMPSAEDFQLQT